MPGGYAELHGMYIDFDANKMSLLQSPSWSGMLVTVKYQALRFYCTSSGQKVRASNPSKSYICFIAISDPWNDNHAV